MNDENCKLGQLYIASGPAVRKNMVLSYLLPEILRVVRRAQVVEDKKPVQLSLFPDAGEKLPDRLF